MRIPGISKAGRATTPALWLGIVLAGHCAAAPGAQACDIDVGSGSTVTLNADTTADCVTVASGGTLNIGATLTLTGPGASTVNGTVNLTRSTSALVFSTNHTISGSGEVHGQDSSADIYIPEGETLTNAAEISGCLRIYGPGSFVNHGMVNANANGTLKIAVGGTVDDGNVTVGSDDDRWQASAASAVLWISSDIGTLDSLVGDFVLSNGTIKIDKALTTVGRLQISGGTLDVNEDTTMGQDYIEGVQPARSLSASGGTIDVENGNRFEHK